MYIKKTEYRGVLLLSVCCTVIRLYIRCDLCVCCIYTTKRLFYSMSYFIRKLLKLWNKKKNIQSQLVKQRKLSKRIVLMEHNREVNTWSDFNFHIILCGAFSLSLSLSYLYSQKNRKSKGNETTTVPKCSLIMIIPPRKCGSYNHIWGFFVIFRIVSYKYIYIQPSSSCHDDDKSSLLNYRQQEREKIKNVHKWMKWKNALFKHSYIFVNIKLCNGSFQV